MLKLEESHPFESLGSGSISKVNNIDMGERGGGGGGGGGDQCTFS